MKIEKRQHEEDQQTLTNIESAIPQSNIGFKMLRQMGYTPGSALGKEGSGRAEPVGLEIRRGRAGLGREDPKKEKMRKEKMSVSRKIVKEKELMEEFGCRLKEHWRSRRVLVNFHKAKAALAQLENKEIVEEEKKDDEDGGNEEEEEEEEITEKDLQEILMKLRDEFHYCLFCGCQYESREALLSNCPGTDEDDHQLFCVQLQNCKKKRAICRWFTFIERLMWVCVHHVNRRLFDGITKQKLEHMAFRHPVRSQIYLKRKATWTCHLIDSKFRPVHL